MIVLEIARQVQLELLPDNDPEIPNFEISAYVFPTEEVSGDYYDWVKIFEDQIGIVVADAVGKGMPAALLMSFLRASLRAGMQLATPHTLLWPRSTTCYGIRFGTINSSRPFTEFSIRPIGPLFSLTPDTIHLCSSSPTANTALSNTAICRSGCFARSAIISILYGSSVVR